MTDWAGITDSEDYQGGGFTASLWLATGSRELAIATFTMGTSSAVQAGRAGSWATRLNTGLRTSEAIDAGYNAGAGIINIAQGNYGSGGLQLLTSAISVPGAFGKNFNVGRRDPARLADRSWKGLLEGAAHASPAHKVRTYREAIRMAKSGDYERIYLNKSLKTATKGRVSGVSSVRSLRVEASEFDAGVGGGESPVHDA